MTKNRPSKAISKSLMVVAAIAAAPAVTVAAGPPQFPDYDVKTYCSSPANRNVVPGMDLSRMTEQECATQQYAMRALAVMWWPKVSQKARAECNQWGEYIALQTCLFSHKDDDALR